MKIQIRNKNELLDCELLSANSEFLIVSANRNLIENFLYDAKFPEIAGEEFFKIEVVECQQLKLRTYQLRLKFCDLKSHIKKKLDSFIISASMKKFELAIAKAISVVLGKIIKAEMSDLKYQISDIDRFHFMNSIVVSVVGDIKGSAILNFDEELKKVIAKEMWSFAQISELSEENIFEALKEFVNMVLGNTTTILSNNMGVKCNIKSPTVINDKYIEKNENLRLHQVNLDFKLEDILYNISLIFLQAA